nr:hypothetical protein [Tanacetum cinerariifolium]
MTDKYFVEYIGIEVKHFRDTLLQHMGNVKKSVAERTRHQRRYDSRVNKRQMQMQESKIDTGKAVDAGLVVTKSSGTELEVQDNGSRSGNDTDADDAYIRPIYDEEPMAETFVVYEKTSPRSDLRWKPTGRIFKSVGLRWIPTGKLFDSCTSKVNSEPTHGSNVDIPNIHESKQTLDLSTDTLTNVQKKQSLDLSTEIPSADTIIMTSMIELESLFGPFFDKYFNGDNQVVSKSFIVTTADAFDKRQQQPDSTSSTSALATTVTADGNFDLGSNTLSWKPCQGDSLNLPDHKYSIYTIKQDTVGTNIGVAASFQRSQIHKPHSYSSFQSQSFNNKTVDSKLPHHQRSLKSNKESSIGEDC